MTAHKPDQDEFDPALEEAADFPYEEESFAEGEPSEEESWDKGFEEDGDIVDESEEPQKAPRKKGGLFNILLIGGALIVGGGFIYMKVIAPGSPAPATTAVTQTEVPVTSTEPVQEVQADVPALPASDNPVAESLPESAPEMTPEPPAVAVAEAIPPQEVPAAPSVADIVPVLTDETVQQVTPEVSPDSPAVNPSDTVPELASIMKSDSAVESPTPPMPSPISAPDAVPVTDNATPAYPVTGTMQMTDIPEPVKDNVAPADSMSDETAKAIDEKLSRLLTRLDSFEGRIASLEGGLKEVSSQPAPAAVPADMSEISGAIKALEQKITTLEKRPAAQPVAETAEKPVFVPAAEKSAESPVVPLEEPVSQIPEETAAVPVTAPAAESPAPVKPKTVTPKPAAAKVTAWVLRSAQPGAAMIAPKAGGDMKSVRVGDTVSGLGRIIAIEQKHQQKQGRWVVQGTTGVIAQ